MTPHQHPAGMYDFRVENPVPPAAGIEPKAARSGGMSAFRVES